MRSRHSLGSVTRLYLDIVAGGAGVITQSPTIAIQRRVDGKWLHAGDGTWETAKVENAMSQTDSVNLPGRYHFDFDQSLDTHSSSREYEVKKVNAAGTLALEYESLIYGPLSGVTNPELCSVQGTIFDAMGNPSRNQVVRATLEPVHRDSLGRAIEADRIVSTYTNELGDFDLPLVRGAIFRLEIDAVGYNRRVVIPDSAFVLFTDL